ncbi:hypothetical protein [Francisella philomiragia]|uniref:BNR/Asp-box repeat domain protein n=1 Tax=Francisella philomiragia TaxID=28110 RepID=A0AAW3DCF3_9GAMM|nr:hypothetical protein [Francisella philomiragia]KFJ43476.1 putative bNR/Asp-box repeat domain protein [Francisella philomiragia]MBK2254338.1 hypothetical protein [Francisella philomiragia]MBK2258888.1 hypothetical protein [Francisella philomiragia]MBK2266657.1 hypothetical protein [Francisella philomiragia]MBK2272869.1 hypothetical protein [Francisella philomiragia]
MKKKIFIFSVIISVVVAVSGIAYYFHYQSELEEKAAEAAAKEAEMPKPHDYCLITYLESSDNGKTWHKTNVTTGKKPMFKAQCWKKYIQILDGFSASIDKNGQWCNKIDDNKIIAHPAMYFSDQPFESKDELAPKVDTPNEALQDNKAN